MDHLSLVFEYRSNILCVRHKQHCFLGYKDVLNLQRGLFVCCSIIVGLQFHQLRTASLPHEQVESGSYETEESGFFPSAQENVPWETV